MHPGSPQSWELATGGLQGARGPEPPQPRQRTAEELAEFQRRHQHWLSLPTMGVRELALYLAGQMDEGESHRVDDMRGSDLAAALSEV